MRRILAAALLGTLAVTAGASAKEANDLRDFRVGMKVADLETKSYDGFACEADPSMTLSGWQDFRRCPKTADGLYAVGFRYRDDPVLGTVSEDGQGTKVAGQPVLLALLVDADGVLAGLHMRTDPAVRIFKRRRANVFALQAMARYGTAGWSCTKGVPNAHAQPIGDTFVDDRCEKTADGKRYVVDRMLFRDPDRPLKDFVSKASVSITRAKP